MNDVKLCFFNSPFGGIGKKVRDRYYLLSLFTLKKFADMIE